MLNQLVIVGRLAEDLKLIDDELNIILAVPRCFKNEEGIYETDFIPVVLKGNIATNTKKYCKKGDIIGVKGRASSAKMNDGTYKIELVAEKVTFLSTGEQVE